MTKMQRGNHRNLLNTQMTLELRTNDNNENAKSELSTPLRTNNK